MKKRTVRAVRLSVSFVDANGEELTDPAETVTTIPEAEEMTEGGQPMIHFINRAMGKEIMRAIHVLRCA